ncbi:hypothetical protein GLE_4919 [Lysobacter enzymogenes]|uniref:Uncharacterized protein n=1 Tax=Lysobacter enzymogenes TaxID=69 RepID=A0A0S2DNX1_LYSEN|nr:hypothetical protein GLE_4919 [Lysobacter enzymogenes]
MRSGLSLKPIANLRHPAAGAARAATAKPRLRRELEVSRSRLAPLLQSESKPRWVPARAIPKTKKPSREARAFRGEPDRLSASSS